MKLFFILYLTLLGSSKVFANDEHAQAYLNNEAIPATLRAALEDNDEQTDEFINHYLEACRTVHQFQIAQFYRDDIQNQIINERPAVCNAFHIEGSRFDATLTLNLEQLRSLKSQEDHNRHLIDLVLNENDSTKTEIKKDIALIITHTVLRYLKMAMMARLWRHLTTIEQMEANIQCSNFSGYSNNKIFWRESSVDQPTGSYNHFISICNADEINELVPYFDYSILREYLLYYKSSYGNHGRYTEVLARLCHELPEAALGTSQPLPPISLQELYFNMHNDQRTRDNELYGLAVFNLIESINNPSELDAIRRYSSRDYMQMNAYEQWGPLSSLFVPESSRLGQAHEPNEALGPVGIAQSNRDLKAALLNSEMDTFQGIVFSAQQLDFRERRSIREGSTFTPGHFLSTSIQISTADGFLRRIDNEHKYLFVIQSENGVPIRNASYHRRENEVLFHPDSRFLILKTEAAQRSSEDITIVYMQEITE